MLHTFPSLLDITDGIFESKVEKQWRYLVKHRHDFVFTLQYFLLYNGLRGYIQKFPDSADNKINNNNNNKQSLRSNTKGYDGRTH